MVKLGNVNFSPLKMRVSKAQQTIISGLIIFSLLFSQTGLFYIVKSELNPKTKTALATTETISLDKGWNMISISKGQATKNDLSGCDIDSGPWIWHPDKQTYKKANKLTAMNAYWVHVKNSCNLSITTSGDTQKTNKLKQGWNMISVSENKVKWDNIRASCRIETKPYYAYRYFYGVKGQDYTLMRAEEDKIDPQGGYWVIVEGNCAISLKTKSISIGGLPGLNPGFNCYLSQGNPQDKCGGTKIITQGGTDYCRHPNPNCIKSKTGKYVWDCNVSKDPRPAGAKWADAECTPSGWKKSPNCTAHIIQKGGEEYCKWPQNPQCIGGEKECNYTETKKPGTGNYECTIAGWEQAPSTTKKQTAPCAPHPLSINPCDFGLGKLLSSLFSGLISSFSKETIAATFGSDAAKKLQFVVDFYFYLKQQGYSDQDILNLSTSDLEALINEFLNYGVQSLGNIAANKIRKIIIKFAVDLKLNPSLAQEIGNFVQFLIKEGINNPASLSVNQLADKLWEYVQTQHSPLLQKLLQLKKITAILSLSLQVQPQEIENVFLFLKFLLDEKGLTLNEISAQIDTNLSTWLNDFKAQTGITITLNKDGLKVSIKFIAENILQEVLSEYQLNIHDVKTLIGFIQYLLNQGLTLQEIVGKSKSELKALWEDFVASQNIALQLDFDDIYISIQIILSQGLNKIFVELNADLNVSPQVIKNTIKLLRWLLFDKGLSFDQILNNLDNIDKWIANSGISFTVNSATIKQAIQFIAQQLKGLDVISQETAKFIVDFINFVLNIQGKDFSIFIKLEVNELITSLEAYISSEGIQIIVNVSSDLILPYLQEATGIDPSLLAEIAFFANWLVNTKNINLNNLASYAIDELIDQYLSKQLNRLTGIPTWLLRNILHLVIEENLVNDIVNLDLQALIRKLAIEVKINGDFCPELMAVASGDLMTLLCQALDPNQWKRCNTGRLTFKQGDPYEIILHDKDMRRVWWSPCTVPNIYVSILGQPIITGITFRAGPLIYGPKSDPTKLFITMPTKNRIWWGDGTNEGHIYKARRKTGLSHVYKHKGKYKIKARCGFVINIEDYPTPDSCSFRGKGSSRKLKIDNSGNIQQLGDLLPTNPPSNSYCWWTLWWN